MNVGGLYDCVYALHFWSRAARRIGLDSRHVLCSSALLVFLNLRSIVVSDGRNVQHSMLATQLNSLVASNALRQHAVIRVTKVPLLSDS